MSTSTQRRSGRVRIAHAGIAATAVAVGLGCLTMAPAQAADPRPTTGEGEIHLTSAVQTSHGSTLSFAGTGFDDNNDTGSYQKLSVKIDDGAYAGGEGGVVATTQVQGDGSVSGSITVPEDLADLSTDGTSGTGTAAGEHWLRFLASTPVTSQTSDYFTLSEDAAQAPTVTATATTATGRSSGVTVSVTGSGFAPGQAVTVEDGATGTAYTWATGGTADESGALTGTLTRFAIGAYPAGEHQLVLTGGDAANPGVAQVSVQPAIAFAGLAVGSSGTVTVSNLTPGAEFAGVELDPSPADGDEIALLDQSITADASGVATGAVTVPDGEYLGTQDLTLSQSKPYAQTYRTSSKVSPSSTTFGEAKYDRVETGSGDVAQGLYQSAYSATQDALYATAAFSGTGGWDGYLYKLDPDTLKVLDSERAAPVDPTGAPEGARFAQYGVGVDDTNGTVWVTNTRQNTVAVYSQDDLSLLSQLPANTITHSRDVIADPANGYVFVSSASEGNSGNGVIGVFEADDLDADGVKYEFVKNIAEYPRTTFSPMSLELDAANGKLFSVSSASQKAIVIDTATLDEHLIDLPDLTASNSRGASGVAYDAVTNRLFIASQVSDEVMIAQLNDDMTEGTTVKEIATGAQTLNSAFDPVNRLLYVANFGGTTITVLDVDGNRVANLPLARPNHLHEDGQGSVYAVNKADNNQIIKLTPKADDGGTVPPVKQRLTVGRPAYTGAVKVGGTLSARTGAWTKGTTFSYQWKRNGASIRGAVKRTYTATPADAGRRLTVTVTGRKAGYTTASATSPARVVAKGALSAAQPTITGKAKVGKILKARAGRWTAGTRLSYQWFANGKVIKQARKATLKLKTAQRGKRITVKVTGAKSGYATAIKVSKRTAKVKR
ncbi:hypothetical protein [Nocardioides insulae]|uniref:hypothetical protein n=1 Tax=Nocardioides insulae TaxID=394734 RepID=UPI00040C3161|nr:hypothetical protein [Nocardioides insulae]